MSDTRAVNPPAPASTDHVAPSSIEIFAVHGIGDLRPGDDLAAMIAEHAPPLRDGDVLVVTSKAISKIEGRLITLPSDDADEREAARQRAIDSETVRVVARRGPLRIVQTRHGLVLAAAGVDASNVARNELALLPLEPDTSAAQLRQAIHDRVGVTVAVVISDSMGRPWRNGITDQAIGAAGISAIIDERGNIDNYGNILDVTQVAIVDEVAAAADLVKGKRTGVPVAVVRGLASAGMLAADGLATDGLPDDGTGTCSLIRGADDDLFRLGTAEAIARGREDIGAGLDELPALHADAVRVVSDFVPQNKTESTLQQAFLGFLAARSDAMWRSCAAGHLTASALVIDPSQRTVLLTLHPRVGLWVQVGGHCEPGDQTILDAAAREAREESGIGALSLDPAPLGLDLHPLTCSLGVPTRHFDVRFLALAPAGAQPVRSDESLDLRWFAWDDLPEGTSAELPALIRAARERLEAW